MMLKMMKQQAATPQAPKQQQAPKRQQAAK
jgi:hypothetical protein